jgi:large subunit ribosomal protein L13
MKKMDVNKTFSARPEDVAHQWYIIDAADMVLGRLATTVAAILTGKNKPTYTPHVDTGDYVIVINAEKVHLTGQKEEKKTYNWHTGFPGGFRTRTFKEMLAKHPEQVIEKAVKGMLPKNKLGRQMYKKLKVYVGSEHPHEAQQPSKISL